MIPVRGDRRSQVRQFSSGSKRLPSTVMHISGLALLVVAPGVAVSAIVEFVGGGGAGWDLVLCSLIFAVIGGVMWTATELGDLQPRTVFASVAWSWLLVSLLGALPFVLSRTFQRDGVGRWVELADAVFESVSGYTCTGSTVLTTLPDLGDPDPQVGKGVLFYRQLIQWYGGMGFVQLVITVLPALGSRALGFMGAEAPGPTADRLAPRAAESAKILWQVYIGVTLLMAVGYRLAGMNNFDSFAHALSTAATGGFSTYNESIGEFDSVAIEVVAMVAMLIGGANFALHWLFISRDRSVYFADHEFRSYIGITVVVTAAVTIMLTVGDEVGGFFESLRYGSFNVVSLATSTGFGNAQGSGTPGDFVRWAASPLVLLLILMAVGGMSGSTAGGAKVIRFRVLAAIAHRTVALVRQPRSVVPLRLGKDVVSEKVAAQISVFMMAYLALVVAGLVAVTALGGEFEASVAGVIGSIGNMGPAFGDAGPTATFLDAFPTPARMVLALLMLAGRLELFAVLLMFAAPRRSIRSLVPHRHTF
ncbi:MAG: TrkH family potassium uptake protein [Acidimicrobiales bacterium]